MTSDIELLEHQLRPARRAPEGALVLLHGRGTNEFDLLPFLNELDLERRLVGVTRGRHSNPHREHFTGMSRAPPATRTATRSIGRTASSAAGSIPCRTRWAFPGPGLCSVGCRWGR